MAVLEEVAEEYGITYAKHWIAAQYSEGEDYFYSAGSYVGLDAKFWEAYIEVTGREVTLGGYDDGCRGC